MGTLNLNDWSSTASSNDAADSGIPLPEGMPPGNVNDASRAIMAALARYLKDTNGTLTTGGSSNAYTLAAPNVTYTALASGLRIRARASFTNTGAATFNLQSLGAKPIKYFGASGEADVLAGHIQVSMPADLEYDATLASGGGAWVLLNPCFEGNAESVGTIRIWTGGVLPNPNWDWCDGAAISRTVAGARLFALVGTAFGVGDGSTTFNKPDLRGRVVAGRDNLGLNGAAGRMTSWTTLGATTGTQTHTLTIPEMPVHTPAGTVGTSTGTGTSSTSAAAMLGAMGLFVLGIVGSPGSATSTLLLANTDVGGVSIPISNSLSGDAVGTVSVSNTAPTFTGTPVGSGTAHNNTQPSIALNYIIRL